MRSSYLSAVVRPPQNRPITPSDSHPTNVFAAATAAALGHPSWLYPPLRRSASLDRVCSCHDQAWDEQTRRSIAAGTAHRVLVNSVQPDRAQPAGYLATGRLLQVCGGFLRNVTHFPTRAPHEPERRNSLARCIVSRGHRHRLGPF